MLQRIIKNLGPNEPDEYIPTSSEGLEENFLEIEKMMKTSGSQHNIKGDARYFTIGRTQIHNGIRVFGLLLSSWFIIAGLGMAIRSDNSEGIWTLLGCWGMSSILLYHMFKRVKEPEMRTLTVDVDNRLLTLREDNFLRRRFTAAELIHINSITRLWAEPLTIKSKGVSYQWQIIYAEHGNGVSQIMALPDGYSVYVSTDNFITCFSRMIKAK